MTDSLGGAVHPEPVEAELFAYGRQVAPLLWAFVALAAIEMAVVHLLLWHWSRALALVLGGLSAATLVWLVALLLSFRRRPVEIGPRSLRVRTGFLIDAEVRLADIAFVQSGYASADYMPGGLLKASLLAYPNAVVLLRRDVSLPGPFGRKRNVHAVALAVDEPARFLARLERRVKQAVEKDGTLAA